jgi:hypothetical protein
MNAFFDLVDRLVAWDDTDVNENPDTEKQQTDESLFSPNQADVDETVSVGDLVSWRSLESPAATLVGVILRENLGLFLVRFAGPLPCLKEGMLEV